MTIENIAKISQKIVTFLLKNEDKRISEAYRMMISDACPELQIFINDDEKLCEEYIATMITHRVNGFPFPKESKSETLSALLAETKVNVVEFMDWLEIVKETAFSGECRIHFGIENPVFAN